MRREWLAALLAIAAATVVTMTAVEARQASRGPASAPAQLEAATKKEVVDGDLKAAIDIYRKLADGPDRVVAAQALAAMGRCYEKLGSAQTAEARKAYERLVRDFAEQKTVVEQARARLVALAPGSTGAVTSAPGTLRQLYEGNGHPAPGAPLYLSFDGRYAVFPQFRPDPQTFVIRDLVQRRDLRVVHASSESLIAAWRTSPSEQAKVTATILIGVLPDQNRCVYTVFLHASENGRPVRRQQQFRMVNFDSSDDRMIAKLDNQSIEFPRLSRDGRTLLTALWTAASADGEAEEVAATSIRLSDGLMTRLAPPVKLQKGDYVMFPSADGRLMAVWQTREDGMGALAVIDAQTGRRTGIKEDKQLNVVEDWTADGGLVFSVLSGESSGIYVARRTGPGELGPADLFKSVVGKIWLTGVGGDGTVYYATGRERGEHYSVAIDPATGKVKGEPTLLPWLRGACGSEWSRDGSSITYAARMNGSEEGESAPCTLIVTRNLSDGRERVLSPGLTAVQRARWSPDRTRLAVFGQKDGKYGVFLVDPATSSAQLVAEAPPNQPPGDDMLAQDWTADGKALLLGRRDQSRWRIVRHDLQSGVETELYSIKGGGAAARIFFATTTVAVDGSVCVMTNEANGDRAAVYVPADGTPARTVFRVPSDRRFASSKITWDGRAVYVCERRPDADAANTRKLVRIPVEGGDPIDAGLSLPGLDNLRPSPDGTRLIFAAWQNVVTLWAVDRLLSPDTTMKPSAKAAAAPKK